MKNQNQKCCYIFDKKTGQEYQKIQLENLIERRHRKFAQKLLKLMTFDVQVRKSIFPVGKVEMNILAFPSITRCGHKLSLFSRLDEKYMVRIVFLPW